MSALPQLVPGCIQANPDISGIGVRVAIYTQNFLSLTLAIVALGNRHVSWREMLTIEMQSMSVLLTACALLLSAVVQAATFGMSTYHALVVLNLAWMNNTNTLIYAILFRYRRVGSAPSSPYWSNTPINERPPKRRAIPILAIGSFHLSFAAGFGLWFWAKVDTFGASAQCTPELPVSLVIFRQAVPVTSHALQRVSLATYSIIAAPGLNLVVALGVIYGFATACVRLGLLFFRISNSAAFFAPGYVSVALLVAINIVLATDTETMINHTKGLVQPGESQWTFGQTLAIFLLILPLRDIVLTLFGSEDNPEIRAATQDDQRTANRRARKRSKGNQRPITRPGSPLHPTRNPPREGNRPAHKLFARHRLSHRSSSYHQSQFRMPSLRAEQRLTLFPTRPASSQIIMPSSFSMSPISPLQAVSLVSSPIDLPSISLGSSRRLYRSHSARLTSWSSSRTRFTSHGSPDLSIYSYLPQSPPLSSPMSPITPRTPTLPFSLTRRRSQSVPPSPSSATLISFPQSPATSMADSLAFPFPPLHPVSRSSDNSQGGGRAHEQRDKSPIISHPTALRARRAGVKSDHS